jgi:cytochrome c553
MMSRRATLAAACALALGTLAASGAWAGNAARGKELSAPCAACHGVDGNSAAADFPRIAGQHEDYLLRALQHYKNGKRKNAIMQGQVANLSKRDMQDLAAFFSGQQGLFVKR